jgi:hypothetical protein
MKREVGLGVKVDVHPGKRLAGEEGLGEGEGKGLWRSPQGLAGGD